MGYISLSWKNKDIYDFSGGVFESLYNQLFLMYASDELDLSDDLASLINNLEYPDGKDLSSYIHSKKDFLLFNKMVRIGLDRMYLEYPTLPKHSKEHLENFYKQLVEIAKVYPN